MSLSYPTHLSLSLSLSLSLEREREREGEGERERLESGGGFFVPALGNGLEANLILHIISAVFRFRVHTAISQRPGADGVKKGTSHQTAPGYLGLG